MTTYSLDLGSGPVPKNPFGADVVYGADIGVLGDGGINPAYPENVVYWDAIQQKIPFEDNSLDYVVCTDFLEHIPRIIYLPGFAGMAIRKQPFIDVMSEVWRVLKPGGTFQAKTPAYPTPQAFQDPTHVNFITEATWDYFAGGMVELCQEYGFKGRFSLNGQWWENYWLVWEMEAVK